MLSDSPGHVAKSRQKSHLVLWAASGILLPGGSCIESCWAWYRGTFLSPTQSSESGPLGVRPGGRLPRIILKVSILERKCQKHRSGTARAVHPYSRAQLSTRHCSRKLSMSQMTLENTLIIPESAVQSYFMSNRNSAIIKYYYHFTFCTT